MSSPTNENKLHRDATREPWTLKSSKTCGRSRPWGDQCYTAASSRIALQPISISFKRLISSSASVLRPWFIPINQFLQPPLEGGRPHWPPPPLKPSEPLHSLPRVIDMQLERPYGQTDHSEPPTPRYLQSKLWSRKPQQYFNTWPSSVHPLPP